MQDDKRLWEEWCYYLAQKSSIDKEDIFSQKVVTLLEKMGWSQFDKELERERSIPVGSSQTIRSDILLHQKQNKKTLVIELKQPSIPFNDSFRNQLFSYMRLIRSDVGLLIGSEIEFYYDPPTAPPDSKPGLLFRLSLRQEEKLGPAFVRLITKINYGTEASETEIQGLAEQYQNNLQQIDNKPPTHRHPRVVPTRPPIQASSYRDTEKGVLDVIKEWQTEGRKKTPWGHIIVTKGKYSQAALIDACLCVEGGMSRDRISQNSGVTVGRVTNHIENDLKSGRRNSKKALKIKVLHIHGEIHEYIDQTDLSE